MSQKKQTIGQRCIACGYNGMVDMRHKLTPFILKNPPDMVSMQDNHDNIKYLYKSLYIFWGIADTTAALG